MRVRGPYPLFNPLSISELALQGLGTGLQIYNTYNQQKAMDFARNAALTGQPATELPGGAIRHFLSTVTGGLVSPNEDITGQGAMEQNAVLGQQQKTKLAEISELTRARSVLGPGAFAPGTPLGNESGRLGLNMPNATPIEQYRNTQADIANQRLGIDQNRAEQQKIDSAQRQQNFNTSLGLREKTLATAEAGLGLREKGLSLEEERMSSGYQQLENANKVIGQATGVDNLSLPQYRNRTGKAFVNADDLTINNDPKTTVSQASQNLSLHPVKEGVPLDAINDTKTQIQSLEKLLPLVDKVYPPAGVSNKAAGVIEGAATGISNIINRNDPNVQAFRRAGVEMDGYLKRMTGRFPGAQLYQQQIDELIPNPGMVGLHPTLRPYTADVAKTMIQNTIQSLKEHAVDSALNESRTEDEREAATAAAAAP